MSQKLLFCFAMLPSLVLPMVWAEPAPTQVNPTSDGDRLLKLHSGSNCTKLGYPGAVPHIQDGYEYGPGKCCFPITKKGGYIHGMCRVNGGRDEWRPCPPGLCHENIISTANHVWLNKLSAKALCQPSSECEDPDNNRESDVVKAELKLIKGEQLIATLVKDQKEPSSTIHHPLDLVPGNYTIKCTAQGGHPAPTFTLKSSGGVLTQSSNTTVDLTPDIAFVSCTVSVNSHFPKHVMTFDLHVKEVDPKISCSSLPARPGDKRAVIACNVSAPDVTCKNVVWKSGTTNEEFTHGDRKTSRVFLSCQSIGDDQIRTQLELRDLDEDDFEDTYYLKVIGGPGGDYQEGIKLGQKSNDMTGNNNAQTSTASIPVPVALTSVCVFLGHLSLM